MKIDFFWFCMDLINHAIIHKLKRKVHPKVNPLIL